MKLEVGQFARLKSGYSDELGIGKIEFVANCGVATIIFTESSFIILIPFYTFLIQTLQWHPYHNIYIHLNDHQK